MSNPQFPNSGDFSADSGDAPRRLYNPYADLQIPHLPSKSLYSISTSPEFLFQEESLAQRRSWGENLTFFTGVGYLSGAISGAALGLRRAFKETEPGDSKKIRINRILNSCGQEGRRVGNRLGVIGILYAGIEGGIFTARGEDDWVNTIVAGLGTGALFRAANGPRSAVVAGMVGGVVAGAAVVGKQFAKRYVPI